MPYGRCFVLFSYGTGTPQDFRGVSRSKVVVTGIFNRIYIQVSFWAKEIFFVCVVTGPASRALLQALNEMASRPLQALQASALQAFGAERRWTDGSIQAKKIPK